jgi:hypothetical protein
MHVKYIHTCICTYIQGDLGKLVEAIECAPRGVRNQWLTEVTVHGTIVSPLVSCLFVACVCARSVCARVDIQICVHE